MDSEQDWNTFMKDHPVFALPKSVSGSLKQGPHSLELSVKTLPNFTDPNPAIDGPTPSGRRQVMAIKDSDLIVAAGSEIRIASLELKSGPQTSGSEGKSYKILHTPNITFEIHQMVLNPNAKFLAVAGAYQVAVVVLPRASSTRLASTLVDCKAIHIGQDYHNPASSVPIAKIEWHPWGDGGTALMVMSVDGQMREYDISVDTEEPQQTLSFVPERKAKSFMADADAEREVASFTIGKGKADWGPLTIYAVMRSGDIYAICPYMPKNASVPSAYVHALECFVAAKQEFLLSTDVGGSSSSLAAVYDYQHKYVTALLKQLPPGTAFPSASRSILMHPPSQVKVQPIRQGPFLLQPAPLSLEGYEGGDATDIVYLAFGTDEQDTDGETERLGVVLVATQEGKVDVFLDVEKVEARWERKHQTNELPMLAVYESIDLGLISALTKVRALIEKPSLLDLLKGNHPVFLQDPIRDETIYVYHAFGVHALQLGPLLQNLANALRDDISNDGNESLSGALEKAGGTGVQPILTTFSVEWKCSSPIVAVAIPNDVYLTYSIFILTSAMRIKVLPLTLQAEPPIFLGEELAKSRSTAIPKSSLLIFDSDNPPAYISLLEEPYEVPAVFKRESGLPSNAILALPRPDALAGTFQLTPVTLRYLASIVERFCSQVHDVVLAYRAAELRSALQKQEFLRQQQKAKEVLELIKSLRGERERKTREKLEQIQQAQRALLAREDRVLGSLMKKASPDLSESETKWFQELKRMRVEIKGSTRYDQESLTVRTATLRRNLDRLLPSLKELKAKEERLSQKMLNSSTGLGTSQAFELGQRSNAERAKIENLESEIQKLATRLDVTLGRPPPLQPQSDTESE